MIVAHSTLSVNFYFSVGPLVIVPFRHMTRVKYITNGIINLIVNGWYQQGCSQELRWWGFLVCLVLGVLGTCGSSSLSFRFERASSADTAEGGYKLSFECNESAFYNRKQRYPLPCLPPLPSLYLATCSGVLGAGCTTNGPPLFL